ncbi:MAG TPA: hypothetical protein VH518_23800 [Tepidisphaeraceae bacterium]|jgi:hypothetical protein
MPRDPQREFLRHTLATLAYRGSKPLRNAPPGFAETRVCQTSRSAVQILAHIGDLFDWALSMAQGKEKWRNAKPESWDFEVARFYEALAAFDNYLGSEAPLECEAEKLFQGPVADALTHVGQLATLRRLAGAPVRGENYQRADITVGRVGADQPPARREFD